MAEKAHGTLARGRQDSIDFNASVRVLSRPEAVRFAVLEAAEHCAVCGLPETAVAELADLRAKAAAKMTGAGHA